MRRRFLVAYDVCDDKRLRRTHKKMKGYGDPLQYSVFICDLSRKEKSLLISELLEIINGNEDRVAFFDLGSATEDPQKKVEFIGRKDRIPEREALIV